MCFHIICNELYFYFIKRYKNSLLFTILKTYIFSNEKYVGLLVNRNVILARFWYNTNIFISGTKMIESCSLCHFNAYDKADRANHSFF